MSFKIVVDSCCELPEEYLQDPRFEIVPLGLEVGDYRIQDDENFDAGSDLRGLCKDCKGQRTFLLPYCVKSPDP